MKLIPTQSIVVQPSKAAQDQGQLTSVVTFQGVATPSPISGVVLEAAVDSPAGLLLMMTNDVPNEDTLSIHLLNANMVQMDWIKLGRLYNTGVFRSLSIDSNNTLSFCFLGETPWKLTVFEDKQACVPFLSEPKSVSRKLGFKRYMMLEGSFEYETA